MLTPLWMTEKCALWRDFGEEEKLLSFSLSPSVYMKINFNSILGIELIPSSSPHVDRDTIIFSNFVRIKIFSRWTNMTKIHPQTWMINIRKALQGCLCSYVEVILKRDLSCIQSLFLTCSFPSTPPINPLSSGMTAGRADLFKQSQKGTEWSVRKNIFYILLNHTKFSSLSKVVLFFY